MNVVLDSGIWMSGFQFGGTPLLALDEAFVSDHIVICREIVLEISRVLVRKFGWSASDVNAALETYLADAKHVELKGTLRGICRDPKDDMLFECALLGEATLLVSGDNDVLEVGNYKGIRVITARQYLSEI